MAASEKINILMTGAGAPGAAGILRCLEQFRSLHVITADVNPNAVGRFIAKEFETIPFANDPAFAKTILELCKTKSIQLILPLVTRELIPLSLLQKDFEEAGIRLPISPTASLEIANNKSMLYQFLQWRSIAVPEFRVVENLAQFSSAVKELGYPERAVCFKPSVSNGSRGFRIISEKMNELDLLFNHKPNNTYITLDHAERILSSGIFPELLVSEYLPGEEYSVDCLANRGKSVLVVPRVRRRMINGISVEGEFVKNEAIISYCQQIIHELQLHGNIGIQVKANEKGEFLLLEINPRVQGSISSCLGADINLPVLAIKQELGLPLTADEQNVKWGVKFSRFWQEVFY